MRPAQRASASLNVARADGRGEHETRARRHVPRAFCTSLRAERADIDRGRPAPRTRRGTRPEDHAPGRTHYRRPPAHSACGCLRNSTTEAGEPMTACDGYSPSCTTPFAPTTVFRPRITPARMAAP